MLRKTLAAIAGVVCATLPALVFAAEPLVSVDWVKENLGKPGIVFLDIRSAVSGASAKTYERAHIPGAVYSNYAKAGWRVKNKDGVKGMLPSAEQLSKLIGGLGVDNDTHVVIIPAGKKALDMGSATRVYWTFKVAGHDEVSILNGGMAAYTREIDKKTKKPVNPLETGVNKPKAKTFAVSMRPELIADRDAVKAAVDAGAPVLDHRPTDQYLGVTKPGPVKRPGTLPGAINVPEGWITVNGGGMFRSKAELEKLYAYADAPTSGEVINFCNTGHWASLGWFATHEILGDEQAKLYDGSMIEWSATKLPMEQKFK